MRRRGGEDPDRLGRVRQVEPAVPVHRGDLGATALRDEAGRGDVPRRQTALLDERIEPPVRDVGEERAADPIEREMRIALRTARARVATARPLRAIEITKSVNRSLSEAWIAWLPSPSDPDSRAGPFAVAANVSPRVGSWITPIAGWPSRTRPIETQKNGMPFA